MTYLPYSFTIQTDRKNHNRFTCYVVIRSLIEMFKIYKTIVSVMLKNLIFDDVSNLFSSDESIYIYAILGLEIPSFILMIL